MTTVRWENFERSPHVEQFVAVVLGRLHPGVQRIDGAGGDGGRDMQYRSAEKLDFYEVKSFTGRLWTHGPDRRPQIERSLAMAAKHKPTTWTLIAPIDPTPKEDEWFAGLQKKYDFPLTWLGRQWLDDMASEHSDARKYFFEDANAEVIQLLRELQGDNAPVGSIEDVLRRTRNISDKLNELDPYYAFRIIDGPHPAAQIAVPGAVLYVEQGKTDTAEVFTVAVLEKQAGATKDRPLTVNLKLQFARTEQGRQQEHELRQALRFGRHVQVQPGNVQEIKIDAPAGLGGVYAKAQVTFGSADTPSEIRAGRIEVRSPDGRILAAIKLTFTQTTVGLHGYEIKGADNSGIFELTFRVDTQEKTVQMLFHVDHQREVAPEHALPALRLGSVIKEPNLLSLSFDGEDLGGFEALTNDSAPVPDTVVTLFSMIKRIQESLNDWFDVNLNLSWQGIKHIEQAYVLLEGRTIEVPPRNMPVPLTDGMSVASLNAGDLRAERVVTYVDKIAGHDIRLPDCHLRMEPVSFEHADASSDGSEQALAKVGPRTRATMWLNRRGRNPNAD